LVADRPTRGARGLAAQVSGPQAVVDLLYGIHAAETLNEAEALLPTLAPGESVITRDGVWCGAQFRRWPRRGSAEGGVIARSQLLKQLKVQVDAQQQEVLEREQGLGGLRARIHAAEQERRDTSSKFDQLRH